MVPALVVMVTVTAFEVPLPLKLDDVGEALAPVGNPVTLRSKAKPFAPPVLVTARVSLVE